MKDHKTYTLTKAEIQIMNILWEMPDGGCVHDIIARYEDPKPAYTTIATFMKILLNKKFVEYRKVTGKTYFYYPLMTKEEYTRKVMNEVKDNFFGGSGSSFLKFFVREEKLTEDDIVELIKMINQTED
jgi:predicted transcriptional regulator